MEIRDHLNHTNNSLIFGEINGNKTQNIPSLKKVLTEANGKWDKAIQLIFGKDESLRLAVNSIDDVTRLFKPAYYFKIKPPQFIDGAMRMIIEHSFEYSEDAWMVELTKESLCYQILERKGEVDLSKIIAELQELLALARDHYLMAIKSNDEFTLKEQEQKRSNFVAKLSEPVLLFLLAAEAYKLAKHQKPETPSADGRISDQSEAKEVNIIVPQKSGKLELKTFKISRKKLPEPDIKEKQYGVMISETEVQRDIRLKGSKLLADAVVAYLEDGSASDKKKEKLLENVSAISRQEPGKDGMETLVLAEYLTRHIDPEDKQTTRNRLLDAPKALAEKKLAELKAGEAKAKAELSAGEEKAKSIVQLEASENRQLAPYSDDAETSETMHKAFEEVENFALNFYRHDEEKHAAVAKYIYQDFTPVGQLEQKIQNIQKQPKGSEQLRGEPGLKLYLQLCLAEACQKSEFFRKTLKNKELELEELVVNGLLRQPITIPSGITEKIWKLSRDTYLESAQTIFGDYINKVSKPVGLLLGIGNFLKSVQQAENRPPDVIIANMSKKELLTNDFLNTFQDFIANGTNRYAQEKFERTISLVIVPELDSSGQAAALFEIAAKNGFSVFFSPTEVLTCEDINKKSKIEALRRTWASDKQIYESGVLCIPDNVLLERGFEFKLGEFIEKNKNQACVYELDDPISVRSCFTVAGMVARNDDTYFVKEALRGNARLNFKLAWPALGLQFDPDEKFMRLYEAADFSNGVSNDEFLRAHQEMPFALFYHRRGKDGSFEKQRLTGLNTLCISDGGPIPLTEYRVKMYLQRALKLNNPTGISDIGGLKHFVEHGLGGVYDKEVDNSILDAKIYDRNFDEKKKKIRIKGRNNQQHDVDVEVVGGEASEQEKKNP